MYLPPSVARRVAAPSVLDDAAARYDAMRDVALLAATAGCLRNLPRVDETTVTADTDLQLVLVPELWERICPGTRDALRRISSSLAEYDPDLRRPSIFERLLAPALLTRLRERAQVLRLTILRATSLDVRALAEWTWFAIAGSRVAQRYAPEDCVYEPSFTYRLVPALVRRARARSDRGA